MKFVEEEWENLQVEGWGAYVFKEKLKALKNKLKDWNKQVFGDINNRRKDVVRDMNLLDANSEFDDLDVEEQRKRKDLAADLWRISNLQETLLHQKSRLKWIKDGDLNSKFFHSTINWRRRVNYVVGLNINGEWIEEPREVKKEIKEYFEKKFKDELWEAPKLDGISFKQISEVDNVLLTAEFNMDEVKAVGL